ncbi:MAG: response regulator [Rhizobiaceae bacterium]|nr:MAG: response regulator [Rhizobiaceae bacterium]
MKVAIVDDDPAIRTAIARALMAEEVETSTFGSGAEFLESLREQIPDCLMLDLQMPGMTGHDVQRVLKDAGLSTPIIIITGCGDPIAIKRTIDAGAVTCLEKPIDTGMLRAALQQAVAHSRPVVVR